VRQGSPCKQEKEAEACQKKEGLPTPSATDGKTRGEIKRADSVGSGNEGKIKFLKKKHNGILELTEKDQNNTVLRALRSSKVRRGGRRKKRLGEETPKPRTEKVGWAEGGDYSLNKKGLTPTPGSKKNQFRK